MALHWIGTSWKMNKTLAEGLAFAEALGREAERIDSRLQPFVIPPFTLVRDVKKALTNSRIKVGAQNMHWSDAGAWTGEISPLMLKDCGLDLVELGHSERREHFGETDRTVGLKAAAALQHGLTPLICVGETLAQREAGKADDILTTQVEGALANIAEGTQASDLVFAYEPVWAIGENGIPASADYADRQQALIKRAAAGRLGAVPAVLYGVSVNPGNAADLIQQPNIDGLFIGRSAWQPDGYIDILKRVAAALPA